MKKIYIYLALFMFLLSSCESFLDTENLTKKDTSNYPESAEDAVDLLTGVYNAVRLMEMDENGGCAFITAEVLSDDRFAGGGPDDMDWAYIEQYKCNNYNMYRSTWSNAYQAIFRTNMLLETIGNVKWTDEALRSNIEGQAYFLRGYAFFYLARLFGAAPLTLATEPVNAPRASADELFAQIASDLKQAINKMSSTKKVTELGRTSKWAAEALMARAYLFYTGYYKKETMPLAGEGGGSVTKAEVIGYLDDCITNSGFDLYPDFRNLWPYSNELSKRDGYPYAINNDLHWAGEKGANYEAVFVFPSAAKVTWDNVGDCNRMNLYFSMREQDEAGIFPYGKGWGFGTVNPQLWEGWPADDLRRQGSIIDVNDEVEMSAYQWAADHQQDETGYWQKKYVAVNVKRDNGSYVNYSKEMFGDAVNDDYQINNTQDLVVIRFADILLMAAELKEDVALINRVRARAGLAPVGAYSPTVLRNERRWELAFEGLRYFDLLRWGIAGEALNSQNGVNVKDDMADSKIALGDLAIRIQETGGFMPIPLDEISLSNGVLVQTPGW